jgi:hypothetical protein
MTFKQAVLFFITLFWLAMLFMFWVKPATAKYPPVEELLVVNARLVSVKPAPPKTRIPVVIYVEFKNKVLAVESRSNKEAFANLADSVGRDVMMMLPKGIKYKEGELPAVSHFEIVNGPVLLDYKKERDEHIDYMTHSHHKIIYVLSFLFLLFSFLLIRSLRKAALSSKNM